MSARQLTLDGREVEHPTRVRRSMTEHARDVLRYVRECGPVRPVEIGVLLHSAGLREHAGRRDVARLVGCCERASHDGYMALVPLARRGLVERVERGLWAATSTDEEWVGQYDPIACPDCGHVVSVNTLPQHRRRHVDPTSSLRIGVDDQRRMIELYRKRGATVEGVAAQTFTYAGVVSRVLKRNGVHVRRRGGGLSRLDGEDLLRTAELYGAGLSMAQVAHVLGLGHGTVRYRLLRAGVKLRPQGVGNVRRTDEQVAELVAAVDGRHVPTLDYDEDALARLAGARR